MARPFPLPALDQMRAPLLAVALLMGCAPAEGPGTVAELQLGDAAPCGPQAPRDIGRAGGTNPLPVPGDGTRPPRLCNVHFHRPAEHTGIAACPAVETEPTGLACTTEGGEPVRPGDEIEVHWVYTSCPAPAERRGGLADCVCDGPAGPELMVFGQTYAMTADGAGADRELQEPSGDLARYAGSTTGPTWSSGTEDDPRPCSPARVRWAVARQCRALTLSVLDTWCATNEWDEDHAHGVREVIEREDWLAPYDPAAP